MILLNVSISRKVSCLSKTYKIFHMNGQCGFYGDGTSFTQLKLEDCGKAFSCEQYSWWDKRWLSVPLMFFKKENEVSITNIRTNDDKWFASSIKLEEQWNY